MRAGSFGPELPLSVSHQCSVTLWRTDSFNVTVYDFICERGTPSATINKGLFAAACGAKNLAVSSS